MYKKKFAQELHSMIPDIKLETADWERIAEASILISQRVDDDAAPTRLGDPVTSFEAARKVNLSVQRARVMELLWRAARPLTDHELLHEAKRAKYKDTYSGLGSRRLDLVRIGLIEFAGSYGESPSGNRCRRHWLTEYGREWCVSNLHD